MSYVLIVPSAPPSPKARELGGQLAALIREYERDHPSVSSTEIRQAVQVALQTTQRGAPLGLAVTLGALVLVLLGLVAFFLAQG